jgi:hypothetical protein
VSSKANTPSPINIGPIIISPANSIAKTPVIIKNRVTRANNRHNSPGKSKHLRRQPIASNKIPATIIPIVIVVIPKPVASRKTPNPTRTRPNKRVPRHSIL